MHKRVNVHGSFLAAELIAVEILLPLGASPLHHPLQWGKDTKDSHGVQLVVFKAASKLADNGPYGYLLSPRLKLLST